MTRINPYSRYGISSRRSLPKLTHDFPLPMAIHQKFRQNVSTTFRYTTDSPKSWEIVFLEAVCRTCSWSSANFGRFVFSPYHPCALWSSIQTKCHQNQSASSSHSHKYVHTVRKHCITSSTLIITFITSNQYSETWESVYNTRPGIEIVVIA